MFPIRGRLGAQLLAVAAFLAAGCADAFLPFCPFLPTSIRKGICFCSDRGGFRGEYGVRVDGNPESEEPSLTLLTCEFEHTDEGGVQVILNALLPL